MQRAECYGRVILGGGALNTNGGRADGAPENGFGNEAAAKDGGSEVLAPGAGRDVAVVTGGCHKFDGIAKARVDAKRGGCVVGGRGTTGGELSGVGWVGFVVVVVGAGVLTAAGSKALVLATVGAGGRGDGESWKVMGVNTFGAAAAEVRRAEGGALGVTGGSVAGALGSAEASGGGVTGPSAAAVGTAEGRAEGGTAAAAGFEGGTGGTATGGVAGAGAAEALTAAVVGGGTDCAIGAGGAGVGVEGCGLTLGTAGLRAAPSSFLRSGRNVSTTAHVNANTS